MGVFNDNQSANRLHWDYKYTGMQLLPFANKLYTKYRDAEELARNKMAEFMKDMTVSNSDRKVEEVKREIVLYGTLKEQCEVFQHEFARSLDKEYNLGLGDVTFFELTKNSHE